MTHDERISSYIDNELTVEQEQEFLISLAASDGLRKSFRSELVLKKVLHHDEAVMNPPRKLRGAVFATLGLAAATATASKASAAQSATGRTFVRSLFATKLSMLLTAAGLSLSALAGYGVHSIVAPPSEASPAIVRVVNPTPATPTPSMAPVERVPVSAKDKVPASNEASSYHASLHRHAGERISHAALAPKETVRGTSGSGVVTVEPPIIIGR